MNRRVFLDWVVRRAAAAAAAGQVLACRHSEPALAAGPDEAPMQRDGTPAGKRDGKRTARSQIGSHMDGKPTALITSPVFKQHDTGLAHPEKPSRIDAIVDAVAATPWFDKHGMKLAPVAADRDSLARCHAGAYLDTVDREVAALEGGQVRSLSTGDVMISPPSREVALLAAGAACQAIDLVVKGEIANGFCVVRPPGHHARSKQGMGFCLYNNVAVAARHAQSVHGLERVLIVDWDVHHGNGTQDIFYDDPTVFFFSTHQSPWYPGTGGADETGEGRGRGTTLNCPYPAGSGHKQIVNEAFEGRLAEAADRFKPDLVLISAGFDSRIGDPLGRFTLADEDFADLTSLMMRIAETHAENRLVSCLEGGYNLAGLGSAAEAHMKALCGL